MPPESIVETTLRGDSVDDAADWAHVSGWMVGLGEAWTVSCVLPSHNVSLALSRLLPKLSDALTDAGQPWEILVVDSGSDDGTDGLMLGWTQLPGFRWLCLNQNFSAEDSLWSGLERARGDVVVVLDPSLHASLHLLPQMLSRWGQGAPLISVESAAERQLKTWNVEAFGLARGSSSRFRSFGALHDIVVIDRAALTELLALRATA